VFFPETTEEVARIVKELSQAGKPYKIRSKGHSSNDLVLVDRGTVICMQEMSRILEVDQQKGTATVQAGAVLAEIDDHLSKQGWGLPIIGDHNHITAGGFASVGGISPASHRHGLFVDNVLEIEYVTSSGEIRKCSASSGTEFYRLLTGTGRHGVLTTLKLRIIPVKKYETILRNDLKVFTNVDSFVSTSGRYIADPGDVQMERGVWANIPVGGWELQIGQFSPYHEIRQGYFPSLVNRVAYGYLHALGRVAGRLPQAIDVAVKYLGTAGIMLSPLYASIKNVESFTDRVTDSSVGDPTRMFIVLGPVDKYEILFRTLYQLCIRYRRDHKCFTMISIYVKSIRSPYLSKGQDRRFCELMLYVGVNPEGMTEKVLESLVSEIDNTCIEYGALRYMHSKTVKDPERVRRIDPNALYADGPTTGARTKGGSRTLVS
jgi:hypothetical protein